ncbi:thioredoxin family protein [Spirosoma sp. KUDC1026]|uniref:thioredoxin family protein n=1 Tax=Spirosoma sp. KUDC1026 TaxID=2745947 RepID=UPI00159BA5C5|nr:thioredoxin family protein [Spirosoma sp. KUDC1026]QKZ13890.1 thioredoxin family protein [Spirosoma sp. KUDC1026]
MTVPSPLITPDLIASALTYEQYITLSAERLAQGLTTSEEASYNTDEIVGYARLNLARMSRLDRQITLLPEVTAALTEVPESWIWLVLTESWCGDAAQVVPVLHQMAMASSQVEIRFLLRDKHPVVMNVYLTNGGKSIPKLICLRKSDLTKELGTWGPRPAALQSLMNDWKVEQVPFQEVIERAQRWYNTDRTLSLQRELLPCIASWSEVSV